MAQDQFARLKIQVDINTEQVTIFGGEVVSVQGQLRLLRREITNLQDPLNAAFDPKKVEIMNRAIQQLEQQLEVSKARSRELFGTLSLLPGAAGAFFGQIQQGVVALRAFTQVGFKGFLDDIKSLFGGISGSNFANIINEKALNRQQARQETASKYGDTIGTTANIGGTVAGLTALSVATEKQQKAISAAAASNLEFRKISTTLTEVTNAQTGAFERMSMVAKISVKEGMSFKTVLVSMTEAEILAASKLGTLNTAVTSLEGRAAGATAGVVVLTDAEIAEAAAAQGAATATGTFAAVLGGLGEAALIVIGILGTLAAAFAGALLLNASGFIQKIVEMGDAIRNWVVGAREMEGDIKKIGDLIEDNITVLDLDIAANKRSQEEKIANLKKSNASEREIRSAQLEFVKDNLKKTEEALRNAKGYIIDNRTGAVITPEEADKLDKKYVQKFKGNTDLAFQAAEKEYGVAGVRPDAEKLKKIQEDAANQQTDLEARVSDLKTEIASKTNEKLALINEQYRQAALRNIDARIEAEIKKENTSKDNLINLYNERNNIVDQINKNTILLDEEKNQRDQQNRKKAFEAALDDQIRHAQNMVNLHKRETETLSKDSKEFFQSEKDLAQAEYDKSYLEAQKSEHDKEDLILNAEAKLRKSLKDILEKENNAEINKQQTKLNSLLKNSSSYFDAQRELEMARYKKQQDDYKGNAQMLELLEKEHQRNMLNIGFAQQKERADTEEKHAETLKFIDANYFAAKKTAAYSEYVAERQDAEIGSEQEIKAKEAYTERMVQIKQEEIERKHQIALTEVQWAMDIGGILVSLANTYAKGNKDIQHLALAIQSAAQIAKIIIDANTGIAAATASAAPFLANPITAAPAAAQLATVTSLVKTSEYIAIAGVIAATAAGFAQIDGAGGGGSSSGGDTINRGKNYGSGGYIDGPLHSQGGVPAVLEGGEAVMTRGAVTMFAPLLSMLNQAGGGTSFSQAAVGQAKWDNPKSPNNPTEAQVIKTYIVENELTSIQEKQARMKSLSTL
jgi:hypothetical protein